MNGYRVGNRTFPDTPQGRMQAQDYARKNGLRVESELGRPKATPGETPVQRRIQEQKRKGPPTAW